MCWKELWSIFYDLWHTNRSSRMKQPSISCWNHSKKCSLDILSQMRCNILDQIHWFWPNAECSPRFSFSKVPFLQKQTWAQCECSGFTNDHTLCIDCSVQSAQRTYARTNAPRAFMQSFKFTFITSFQVSLTSLKSCANQSKKAIWKCVNVWQLSAENEKTSAECTWKKIRAMKKRQMQKMKFEYRE